MSFAVVTAVASTIALCVAAKARRHLVIALSACLPLTTICSFAVTDQLLARSHGFEAKRARTTTAPGLTVTILSPASGAVLVQNPPATIVVKWCSSGASSVPTHNVFLDGVLVGGAIVGPVPSGCTAGGTTTVSVSPSFGSHTVTAQARDSQNRSASATSTFTLQQPVSLSDYRPEVTPDTRSVEVPLGAAVRDSFTIRNAGTRTALYQLGATCAGAPCTWSPSTLSLAPGALGYIRINYTTPGTSGQLVTLNATATFQDPTLGSIADAGSITTTTAPPAALYQPTVVPVVQATSGTPGVVAPYGFTVANTGRARATYSLNWWGTFGVEATPPPDGATLILDPGQSTRFNVAAKAPPEGQTGRLWLALTAIYGGDEVISAADKMYITGLTTQRNVVVQAPNGSTQLIQPSMTTQVVPFLITNVTGVDRTFTYTSTCTGAATTCRYSESGGAVAEETTTIAPGMQRSVNVYFDVSAESQGTVRLQAYETAAPANIDAATVTLSREPLPGGVRINAVAIQTARSTNETFTQHFYIVNAGAAATTFNYASSSTGSVFQICTGSGVTATLQSGDSTDVGVQCTTVFAHGQSGAIVLTASNQSAHASATVPTTTALGAGAEVNVHDVNPGASVAREQCLTIAVGDNAAYECSQLRVVHPLPSTTTMGQTFTPTLVHTNHNVELINANVTFGPNIVPYRIDARVYNAASNVGDTPISFDWRPEWSNGMPRRIVVPFTVWNLNMNASGAYRYRLEVQVFTPESTFTISDTSTFASANRLVSPFGALWWLDGLERLRFITPLPDQIFWVGGDGSTRLYAKATNPDRPTWLATAALDRPDSITLAGSTYKRHLRGGAWVEFDLSGLHTATVNSRGHRTVLSYTGDLLTSITLPIPPNGTQRTYTFAYEGNPVRLTSVTAPAVGGMPRQVVITDSLDQFGLPHIMAIRDPDSLVTRFEYANWPMSARIDKRGVRTTFEYNYEMLRRATIQMETAADNIVHTFCAAEWSSAAGWAGLNPCAPNVLSVDSVRTWVDGPRLDVPDTTWFSLNRWGGPTNIVNALHDSTIIERTDSRWRLLPTVLIQPNGHRVEARYNDRGLLDTLVDVNPLGDDQIARTQYEWNNRDKVERITAPTGEVSRFGYNANGDREWQEDGRGSLSRTSFTYNASRQLQTIRPAGKTDYDVYRFDYDPLLGNLQSEVSPLGATTTYRRDAIGRVDSIASPANDHQERSQTFVYDVMDRVKVQRDIGPAVAHPRGVAPAVTLTVTTTYDKEGNPLGIERRPDPDFIQRGFPQTQFTYDNAGRKLTESDFAGHLQAWSYDPAGNPRTWDNGRGTAQAPVVVTTDYDWLNRPIRRTVPSITRPAQMGTKRDPFNQQFVCEHPARFPYFSAGVTYDPNVEAQCDFGYTPLPQPLVLPADVAEFTYDKLGNITTANNNDARVTREHYPNGALRTELQAIALLDESIPFDGRFNSHRYQLDYTYDLSGRPLTRTDGIPFCQGCVQEYHYNQAGGFLDRITDGAFGYPTAQFGFQYDSVGRLALANVNTARSTTEFQYDNDNRLTTREVRGNEALVYRDVLGYDRSSRVIGTLMESDVLNPRLRSTTAAYNGLGALSYFSHDPASELLEDEFMTDGLGRRITNTRWLNGQYTAGRHDYDLDRLRLNQQTSSWQSDAPAPPPALQGIDTVTTEYAPTGSIEYSYRAHSQFFETSFFPQAIGSEWTWHVYGADERLRVTQRSTQTAQHPRTVFSEYRYDALGRRVAMRTRWDQFCQGSLPSDCLSTIERTIWDGDQILAEIRTPESTESDTPAGAFYGIVRYTHGVGIDQPLAVWKAGFGGTIPHRSWRGLYEAGTPIDANTAAVSWPARTQDVFFAPDVRVTSIEPTQWIGSLVEGRTDPSGLMYMRNRYYDPKTGQFTQQDPIGLAGGLNLYGFASGDPVNYSDPFGLCPHPPCTGDGDMSEAFRIAGRMLKPAQRPLEVAGTVVTAPLGGEMGLMGKALSWLGAGGRTAIASEAIPVIGRQMDTKRYIGKAGYEVLNLATNAWTFEKNMAWVDDIIRAGKKVLTVTEQTANNLWNAKDQTWSVYKAELERFFRAGYRQVGDFLVPPKP